MISALFLRRAAMAGFVLAGAVLAVPLSANAADLCNRLEERGADYLVCDFPHPADLGLHWADAAGVPYRTFDALAADEKNAGRELRFALNAGMYDTDFRPMGLFVENGERKTRLNTASISAEKGPVPNFYKAPNGVFYITPAGEAGIVTTEAFAKTERQTRLATQSGPLLVIDGELNPILIPDSTDRNRRSAIGVCENGAVRLVISDSRVNFHDLAELFRDRLGCRDVLYLDGGRGTGIYLPSMDRNDRSWHGGFGPMFSYSTPAR